MLWWCVQNSVIAGLLAGLVWLVCRGLRPAPAIRHALWLVVLVKLITPPLVVFTLPLPDEWKMYLAARPTGGTDQNSSDLARGNSLQSMPTVDTWDSGNGLSDRLVDEPQPIDDAQFGQAWSEPLDSPAIESSSDANSNEFSAGRGAAQQAKPAAPDAGATPTHHPAASWLVEWVPVVLLWIWLSGSMAMAMVQTVRIFRMRRLLATGQPASGQLIDEVAAWAAKLRIAAPPTLVVAALASPVVWSLGRPLLVWPGRLSERLTIGARWTVIVHELAHIRRRDHWVGWLELVAGCMWWFNPLFWYVRHQLRNNAELACDAWVVATLPAGRRAYAEALIEVSGLASPSAAPVLAMGMGHSARHTFERRLTMILRERVAYRVPLLAFSGIVLLGLAVLPSFSIGQIFKEARPTAENAAPERPSVTTDDTVAPPQAGSRIVVPVTVEGPADNYLVEVQDTGTVLLGAPRDRISDLEKRLEAMLAEVRAMRQGVSKATITENVHLATRSVEAQPGGVFGLIAREDRPHSGAVPAPGGAADVQTLTRAKYKVPEGKAEALATFLKEFVTDGVETRVDNGAVIVTASPHVQQVIGQFIQLLQPRDNAPKAGGPVSRAPLSVPVLRDVPVEVRLFQNELKEPAVQAVLDTTPVVPGATGLPQDPTAAPAPGATPPALPGSASPQSR